MAKLLRTGLILLLAWPLWAGAASYRAYNTYLHPPFVRADGGGLAVDLVHALNRHMGPDSFELENMPRARFLAMANQSQGRIDGIALFLSPAFLREPLASRVRWSAPLFADHNVLVFREGHVPSKPMPAALRGLRFGAVRGNVYRFLDGMGRRGELQVDEVADEMNNLRKLAAGRIDFTVLNRLHFKALAETEPELQQLAATAEPGGGFLRHVLVSPRLPSQTAQRLDAAVKALQSDPEWQASLEKAGVTSK